MIDYSDYTLGLNIDDFQTIEEKYLYSYFSKKGNLLSGGKKRSPISLLEKVVNYMMKQGRNTGKKEKCYNQLCSIITQLEEKENKNGVYILIKSIFNGMPYMGIRRERRGSGNITRAVYLSLDKRLIFSLSSLTKTLASVRKRKKGYQESFVREVLLCYNNDPSSDMIKKRKESELMAKSSNY